MARKPNYSFEKNSRAKAKADKKEAKRVAKLSGKSEADSDGLAIATEDESGEEASTEDLDD